MLYCRESWSAAQTRAVGLAAHSQLRGNAVTAEGQTNSHLEHSSGVTSSKKAFLVHPLFPPEPLDERRKCSFMEIYHVLSMLSQLLKYSGLWGHVCPTHQTVRPRRAKADLIQPSL